MRRWGAGIVVRAAWCSDLSVLFVGLASVFEVTRTTHPRLRKILANLQGADLPHHLSGVASGMVMMMEL